MALSTVDTFRNWNAIFSFSQSVSASSANPPQKRCKIVTDEDDNQDEDANTAVEKENGRAGKGKAKSSSTGDDFVVDPVALQAGKNEWCAKAEATIDDVSDEDVLDYGIDQSAASDDGSPPLSPPLTFDELPDLFHTDEMREFLRKLHTPRFAKGQRCPKASSSSTNSANSIFIDQPTSREFVSKAKYLLFKAMQDALLEAEPHLDAAEMIHYHGSLKSSTIASMHYLTYTVKNTQYQSIADTSNPCIRWIDDHFDLDDMLLLDYYPNRMKRRTREEKVWERTIKSARGHELLREHFKKIWAASEATTGIIFGRQNAHKYKASIPNKIPIKLSDTNIYSRDAHAYLELDSDKNPKRITFLIYHPEAQICAVTGNVKHLQKSTKAIATFNKKSFSLFAQLNRFAPAHRYQGGDDSVEDEDRAFFDRILAMMVEEALMGTPIDEDNVPADIRPHLTYPLPKFDFITKTPLPFGSCTLPVHIIATFDRQGIPLPPLLAAIPKPELDILRSLILQPAKSIMLLTSKYALDRIADPKQQACARNRCIRMWLKYAWYDVVAICDKRSELLDPLNAVRRAVTSLRNDEIYDAQTLWSNFELRIFREIAAYRFDNTDDLEVLQLVNDRLVVLQEHDDFVCQAPRRGVEKNPVLKA
ncbi:hypothetical protein LTR56_002293 [Elasticomyces elasticus]|nr:hypothetical protein LTR56_002293 [Elasticomyces elasticus]KAK3665858.1 hypothetical protein LTR22_003176 [Elasticomyces elasticus]KAK4929330.1 hypothetical protein LTR49_003933 [Elasticomyces elasticus]KAK5764619.1 hypothetical protein LTS12_005119 [Elasticomyces elasticus]